MRYHTFGPLLLILILAVMVLPIVGLIAWSYFVRVLQVSSGAIVNSQFRLLSTKAMIGLLASVWLVLGSASTLHSMVSYTGEMEDGCGMARFLAC